MSGEAVPSDWVDRLNDFLRNNQPSGNRTVQLTLNATLALDTHSDDSEPQEEYPHHVRGYQHNPATPVLRGIDHCIHCLCSPCVIQLPPDFLRGSCGPHPANDEKRHQLYRKFWRLLNTLRVWVDDEYLARKETKTVIHDKREIIPKCVVLEIRRRYPSHNGIYRDYRSTFEAETDEYLPEEAGMETESTSRE
ncbi:uncharacterized protein LOC135344493 [Halichondria panicea]|uniref:uncharacterized protein LOC135344493 n=1 Tax=Halichondria panicea TaxID=6063 RepID=UPI00312B52CA